MSARFTLQSEMRTHKLIIGTEKKRVLSLPSDKESLLSQSKKHLYLQGTLARALPFTGRKLYVEDIKILRCQGNLPSAQTAPLHRASPTHKDKKTDTSAGQKNLF